MSVGFGGRVLKLAALKALVMMVLAATLCGLGGQSEAQKLAFARVLGATTPPSGWVQFCQDQPASCQFRISHPRQALLDGRRWSELVRINLAVNGEIEQVSDEDHHGMVEHWSYPDDGKGDCEDIVLEKQRRLVAAGWPRESLLVTVVRDLQGEGHAILTVKTDRGDYVLDNHVDEIRLWHETGYRFIKRQSQHDINQWVALEGLTRPAPQVATMTRP